MRNKIKKDVVFVDRLPKCNFCGGLAHYDGKTKYGCWAYMCELHFWEYGCGRLGLGWGQRLIKRIPNRKGG